MSYDPYNEEHDTYILPPEVDEDDVNQEAELLRLLGKNPNKALIRAKLNFRGRRAYLFFDDAVGSVTPAFLTPTTSIDTYEYLVEWATQQNKRIATLVFNFLENPSDNALKDLLSRLKDAGLIQEQQKVKKETSDSLTQLIIRHLNVAQPIEELYELARRSIQSNRPEAAVRQLLRRLKSEGRVIDLGNKVFINSSMVKA